MQPARRDATVRSFLHMLSPYQETVTVCASSSLFVSRVSCLSLCLPFVVLSLLRGIFLEGTSLDVLLLSAPAHMMILSFCEHSLRLDRGFLTRSLLVSLRTGCSIRPVAISSFDRVCNFFFIISEVSMMRIETKQEVTSCEDAVPWYDQVDRNQKVPSTEWFCCVIARYQQLSRGPLNEKKNTSRPFRKSLPKSIV